MADAPHLVFISYRINENDGAAVKLRDALHAAGISAFVCDSLPGDDIAAPIANAVDACELFVVLGTAGYGKPGDCKFSTREELQFAVAIDHGKPFFLIKRCSLADPLTFEDPLTRQYLPDNMLFDVWPPYNPIPKDLVEHIRAKLEATAVIAPLDAQQMCVANRC
jgi:hypothetical protein